MIELLLFVWIFQSSRETVNAVLAKTRFIGI